MDFIICAGDWVNYGPEPMAVLDWALDHSVHSICGNHDLAVAACADPKATPFKEPIALAMRDWTRQQLLAEHLDYLAKLPVTCKLTIGGAVFQMLHATPADPLYDYRLKPSLDDTELEALVSNVRADVLFVGHTHLPLVRKLRSLRVVNPGSVGQPLDGDPRAAYAIWNDGDVRLCRADYDRHQALDALHKLTALTRGYRRTLCETLDCGRATGVGQRDPR